MESCKIFVCYMFLSFKQEFSKIVIYLWYQEAKLSNDQNRY
jgi:hypothetical protein